MIQLLYFQKKYKSTAKYNLELIDINVNNGKVPLELWDTTGQEDFKNERGAFLRGADGIVIIYDIDNDDSYKNLRVWLELCKTTCPNESVVIFGNKADKYDDIQMARSAHSRDAKLKTMVGHEKLKHFLISMRDDTHLVFNNNYFGKKVYGSLKGGALAFLNDIKKKKDIKERKNINLDEKSFVDDPDFKFIKMTLNEQSRDRNKNLIKNIVGKYVGITERMKIFEEKLNKIDAC